MYTVFVFLSILREIKYYRRSLRGLDVESKLESMSMRKKGGLLVTGYRIQSTSHRVTERIGYMYTETYARIEYIQFCVFSASASIARVSLSLSLSCTLVNHRSTHSQLTSFIARARTRTTSKRDTG